MLNEGDGSSLETKGGAPRKIEGSFIHGENITIGYKSSNIIDMGDDIIGWKLEMGN